jgi:pimeloyl-ACP methyl ester carboxylesterase
MVVLAGLSIVCGSSTILHAQAPDTAWATVDGHRMRLLVSGSGPTTIVLEAGYGDSHLMWAALQRQLSTTYRVVSYDRAGLGASEVPPHAQSAEIIARELHQALRQTKIEPPYILVGHSAGGPYVRVFASLFPRDVSGLVLTDPSPEDFYDRARKQHPSVYQHFDSLESADTSARSPGELAEDDGWDSTLVQARRLDSLNVARAIVLSSARADLKELGPIWTDEHRLWALRSPRREYVRLEGVGHAIHRERPVAILDAVRGLVNARGQER